MVEIKTNVFHNKNNGQLMTAFSKKKLKSLLGDKIPKRLILDVRGFE